MKYKNILVAGSIAFDFIFKYSGEFKDHFEGHDLGSISTCFFTPERKRFFGGCGGNIAYTYSLFGETPHLVSVAGGDFRGKYEDWLSQHGVNMDFVNIVNDGDTACAYIVTDDCGNQITTFYPGASLIKQDLGLRMEDFTDSLLIISPMNLENMVELADAAHEAGVPYIFDPGQQITLFDAETMRRVAKNAFMVIVNDYELSLMKKHVDPSELKKLIVTKGENGSEVFASGETFQVGVIKPEAIADPTGCGDAYRSGLLYGLKQGYDLEKCCRYGALAATYSIEKEGTHNHAFTLEEFEARLNSPTPSQMP